MLSREKVIRALETKRTQFRAYQLEQRTQRTLVATRLEMFLKWSSGDIMARLAELEKPWPGALPTAELDHAVRLCLPFARPWQNHQDARAWALDTLRDQPVAAVDGSQIPPSKELSLPVGAVQIGWFVNYHQAGGRYEKDVSFEILAPDELIGDGDEGDYPDWRVNQRRFEAECERLCALMETFAREPEDCRPLCFFDGSLIVSFAGQLRPERAAPYLRAVRALLDASESFRVPLVGFVDSSSSRDLLTLLNTVTGPPYVSLTDGALLSSLLPNWGDRTPLFICARLDMLSANGRASFYKQVAFSYIQLSTNRPPARVELPAWLMEAGRADQVLDLVRAECVAGTGYPYAVETADAVAVLQQGDRQRFYALVQQFADQEGLQLTASRKSLSKLGRRG